MAAKTILAGDGVALLHDGIFGGCALRFDGCVDGLFAAQIEAHDSPGDLRFVIVREHSEGRFEAGMGHHVGTHAAADRLQGPVIRFPAIHFEDEQRVMSMDVGRWIVRGVLVVADGDDHRCSALRAKPARQFRQRDAADLHGRSEVCVVGNGVGFLRKRQQRLVGDESRLALRNTLERPTHLEIAGRVARGLKHEAVLRLEGGRTYSHPAQHQKCHQRPACMGHAVIVAEISRISAVERQS